VDQATWIWRQFPRQIASDLSRFHHGRRIADWHRRTRGADGHLILSSYELLELLEFLPETGAFKTDALRGGRWPSWQAMLAESVNESYRMRSAFQAANSEDGKAGFDTEAFEFLDPIDAAARDEVGATKEAETARSVSTFESDISFE